MSLTVLGENWYTHVSLQGRIAEFKADTDFADIDRLSRHYGGNPYPDHEHPRTSAWIEVDRWHAWQSELQSEVAMTQLGLSPLLLLPR